MRALRAVRGSTPRRAASSFSSALFTRSRAREARAKRTRRAMGERVPSHPGTRPLRPTAIRLLGMRL
jgi:hypothetical protein